MKPTLVIFDCDGTLVDSQHAIVASMAHAYASVGLPCPSREKVLGIVGLSLPECFAVLSPELDLATRTELARLYKDGNVWKSVRERIHDPLYEGAHDLVTALAKRDDIVLGVATGKSKRGVDRLVAREGWHGHFFTIQTADDHPSKPHPSMILKAMAETGIDASRTLMIGDTAYDMRMARNAEVAAIGVSWGYHASAMLQEAGAHAIVASFHELSQHIAQRCSPARV